MVWRLVTNGSSHVLRRIRSFIVMHMFISLTIIMIGCRLQLPIYRINVTVPRLDIPNLSIVCCQLSSSCCTGLEDVSSVNDNCLAIEVLVGSNKEHTIAHIAVVTRTSSRNLALKILLWQLTLLVVTTLALSHLTWEDTRSNAVDTNLQSIAGNLPAEHLGQMDDCSLACIVSEVMLSGLHDTRNGTDVDDTTRVALLVIRGSLKKRKEGRGHKVTLRNAEWQYRYAE